MTDMNLESSVGSSSSRFSEAGVRIRITSRAVPSDTCDLNITRPIQRGKVHSEATRVIQIVAL